MAVDMVKVTFACLVVSLCITVPFRLQGVDLELGERANYHRHSNLLGYNSGEFLWEQDFNLRIPVKGVECEVSGSSTREYTRNRFESASDLRRALGQFIAEEPGTRPSLASAYDRLGAWVQETCQNELPPTLDSLYSRSQRIVQLIEERILPALKEHKSRLSDPAHRIVLLAYTVRGVFDDLSYIFSKVRNFSDDRAQSFIASNFSSIFCRFLKGNAAVTRSRLLKSIRWIEANGQTHFHFQQIGPTREKLAELLEEFGARRRGREFAVDCSRRVGGFEWQIEGERYASDETTYTEDYRTLQMSIHGEGRVKGFNLDVEAGFDNRNYSDPLNEDKDQRGHYFTGEGNVALEGVELNSHLHFEREIHPNDIDDRIPETKVADALYELKSMSERLKSWLDKSSVKGELYRLISSSRESLKDGNLEEAVKLIEDFITVACDAGWKRKINPERAQEITQSARSILPFRRDQELDSALSINFPLQVGILEGKLHPTWVKYPADPENNYRLLVGGLRYTYGKEVGGDYWFSFGVERRRKNYLHEPGLEEMENLGEFQLGVSWESLEGQVEIYRNDELVQPGFRLEEKAIGKEITLEWEGKVDVALNISSTSDLSYDSGEIDEETALDLDLEGERKCLEYSVFTSWGQQRTRLSGEVLEAWKPEGEFAIGATYSPTERVEIEFQAQWSFEENSGDSPTVEKSTEFGLGLSWQW